jgi:four helix bundle protein
MNDLANRTKLFAVSIIKLIGILPKNLVSKVISKQILRRGTSVGAQYREARRARSRAKFTSKIDSAIQELDETIYWLELLVDSQITPLDTIQAIYKEAQELIAILVTSSKTAKANKT